MEHRDLLDQVPKQLHGLRFSNCFYVETICSEMINEKAYCASMPPKIFAKLLSAMNGIFLIIKKVILLRGIVDFDHVGIKTNCQ